MNSRQSIRWSMAPPEEMGFRYIQEVQQRESRSHNLTKLPADFFDMLVEHITLLRELAAKELARDPMSTSANLVQNELKNTLSLTEDIVSLRLRKMANRAVDSLEGGKVDLRSLTPRERDVYGELATIFAAAKKELLPSRRAEARPPPRVKADEEGQDGPEADSAPPETPSTPSAVDAEDKVLVHVLEDTPSFAGEGGRSYSLKRGDLVSLPGRLAEVLIGRGLAEIVERDEG